MARNPQAVELNDLIRDHNPHIYTMLSEKGKSIFFPRKGILGQTADAKGCKINATIGSALEDDGSIMSLEPLRRRIDLDPQKAFPYAPSFGRPDIRAKWREMIIEKNPSLADAPISTPVVTSALTHGLSMGGYMFCDPGDTIIVPDKFWGNYRLIFERGYGIQFKTFQMFTDSKAFDLSAFRAALTEGEPGKRIVLLNFPNNPTGYTPTAEEGAQIVHTINEAAEAGNDIVVFVDDAYFGLVYQDGIMPESIFGPCARLHERVLAVKFDGPTKEDYVWGFRVGFTTFGCKNGSPKLFEALEAKLSGAIRGNISNASNIGQSLLLAAYSDAAYPEQKNQKYQTLKARFDRIQDILGSHPEYRDVFEALPCNSGYFMCIQLNGVDSEMLRQTLLKDHSVGVIAQGDLIRIAFSSTPLRLLETLFESIYQAGKSLAG
jgi:aspartate/methionine/tyrosine aminotransferase